MSDKRIPIAVLISGSGTTLQNLIEQIRAGKLQAEIKTVIASRPGIKGIGRAQEAGLSCHVVDKREFANISDFSRTIFKIVDESKVELICLGGWLSLLEIPAHWTNKILNIHPALLPSFGGPGMYGWRVHQAVIHHGCKVSGCTVHYVNADYDNGPIILQRTCAVLEDDTAEALAHRVFEEEKIAYPEAIELYRAGKLKIEGRRVRIQHA